MKITKRIIIRIIVAVVVAVILSKLKLLGVISVNALTQNTTFSYQNQLITNNQMEFNFTTPFATNMKRGTLITNVTISSNIVLVGNERLPILRQAIVYNGTSTNVCKIGSVNTGSIFSNPSSGGDNIYNLQSQTYTLECEVTPNPKIEKVVLYFNGSMNVAYLSFGPNVSFRENDILLEIQKQNETCSPSKNLFNGNLELGTYTNQGVKSSDFTTYRNVSPIPVDPNTTYTFSINGVSQKYAVYYYTSNNTFISSEGLSSGTFTTPSNCAYINFRSFLADWNPNYSSLKIQLEKGSSATSFESYGEVCKSKQDILIDEQKEQTKQQKETNDLIKNDDTSESQSQGSSFFDNFTSDSHGLSGVITAPIRLLNSLTTASCSPLEFDLPFQQGHVSLPCMRGIYEQHFGIFFTLWQLLTTGLISYNVCLNFYSKIRAMQNPYNDRIEVLNL